MCDRIAFTKVEAVGNHFVLVDALRKAERDWPALAVSMCAHHFGIGADGLLVVLPSETADFRLRMFNPDGTEDVCGNGMRCVTAYVHTTGLSAGREMTIEAKDGLHSSEITPAEGGALSVRLNMGRPSLRPADIPAALEVERVLDYPLEVGGDVYRVTGVSVGTPHAVICAPWESLQAVMPPVSAAIETHPAFPERISVTWCSRESAESLRIRTWERGVGPTLGCGTGACAALVAANLKGMTGSFARVTSPGGTLHVEWPDREDIFVSGPANVVFVGEWSGGVVE